MALLYRPVIFLQLSPLPPHSPHLSTLTLEPMTLSQPAFTHWPWTHTEVVSGPQVVPSITCWNRKGGQIRETRPLGADPTQCLPGPDYEVGSSVTILVRANAVKRLRKGGLEIRKGPSGIASEKTNKESTTSRPRGVFQVAQSRLTQSWNLVNIDIEIQFTVACVFSG